ncbi:MAG: hypothetical protein ACXV8W_14955 [Methylobacter sp.]
MRYVLFAVMLAVAFSVSADPRIRTTDISDICTNSTGQFRKVSKSEKMTVYRRDGVIGGNHTGICAGAQGCEVDHRISLELGGSNDTSNLMIQPYFGECNAHDKDRLENRLHKLVCAGALPIEVAQQEIYDDWKAAYRKYVNPAGCGE